MYCFDTSALIQAHNQLAPMDINKTFWDKLSDLARRGGVIAPDEVLREIKVKDDEVHAWCKNLDGCCDDFFAPLLEELQDAASAILREFPRLVDDRPKKGRADPFVIALAQLRGATVVTEEQPTYSKNTKRPKIPDVCIEMGVRSINLVGFMREEEWRF